MKEFEVEVGKRIRSLREKSGYSRERLSEMANIGAKFLYEIESGKKGMSAYTLLNISNALSVSCDYLLKGSLKESNYSYILSILSSMDEKNIPDVEKILLHMSHMSKL